MKTFFFSLPTVLASGFLVASSHASTTVYCVTAGNVLQVGGTTLAICSPPNQPGSGPGERIEYSASRAAYGSLGDGGSAQIQNLSNYASGVEARSSFSDSFIIDSLNPTSGTLLLNITLEGSFAVGGSSNATTNVGGYLDAQGGTFLSGSTGGTDTVVLLNGGVQSLVFAIPYADSQVPTSFNFTLTDYASCSVTGFGSCQARVDYYDTAFVSSYSVQNAQGVVLSDKATFASGTNYNAIAGDAPLTPTPEPRSVLLTGTGLLLLAARQSRPFGRSSGRASTIFS